MIDPVEIIGSSLKRKVVGPGAQQDIWLCDSQEEILSTHPNELYICGKLFSKAKEETDSALEKVQVEDANRLAEQKNVPLLVLPDEDEEDSPPEEPQEDADVEGADDGESSQRRGLINTEQDWQSRYQPSSIGCTFCVSELGKIIIRFEYAKYVKASWNEMRLKISDADYAYLCREREKNGLDADLSKWLIHEDGTLAWKQNPDSFDEPLRPYPEANNVRFEMLRILEPLCRHQRLFKRVPYQVELTVDLSALKKEYLLDDMCSALIHTYKGREEGRYYVKVNILHRHENQSQGQMDKKDILYQIKLTVENPAGEFIPYTERIGNCFDSEYEINQYIYRNEHSYGIGDGCAVEWSTPPTKIWTTAAPEVDVKRYTTEIRDADAYSAIFNLHNLSIWSEMSKDDVVRQLNLFCSAYADWSEKQLSLNNTDSDLHAKLIQKQQCVIHRMRENIEYLQKDDEAYTCFRLANTAMLIQMIVARDPDYDKDRDVSAYNEDRGLYNSLDAFKEKGKTGYSYRPFQLAFLLLNIESTIKADCPDKEIVDLIWFPTGGGKTEAYLALTALTIVARRRRYNGTNEAMRGNGVAVIMRYTLRLLTSQQFERAAYLISALEFLRTKYSTSGLGESPITAGMWLGQHVTPNRVKELKEEGDYERFFREIRRTNYPHKNPFPIKYCPWCGCKLVAENLINNRGNQARPCGYLTTGEMQCINQHCYFNIIPLDYIDERIYQNPPTLLFATVDKFVQLSKNSDEGELFGQGTYEMPNLVIQDELHLINGALGSATGLFERVVDMLFAKYGHKTKVVASTATIRNTELLIERLYNRSACVFPAQGTAYDDNFFSKVVGEDDQEKPLRHHIGFMPLGVSGQSAEIAFLATLLVARIEYFRAYLIEKGVKPLTDEGQLNYAGVYECLTKDEKLTTEIDNYWTLLCYYNSIKDVGRTASRVANDIYNRVRTMCRYDSYSLVLNFAISHFYNRKSEFTSRMDSHDIKKLLTESEGCVTCRVGDSGVPFVAEGKDIILATNMISVGLDISRFNLMYMSGQPRQVAEYIQASSRVARKERGLVVNVFSPYRIREKSIFEDYKAFHNVYYKYVEPLSITPYTVAAVDKLIYNMVGVYVYQYLRIDFREIKDNYDLTGIQNLFADLANYLKDQCEDQVVKEYIDAKMQEVAGEIKNSKDPDQTIRDKYMMNALRDIDPNVFYQID